MIIKIKLSSAVEKVSTVRQVLRKKKERTSVLLRSMSPPAQVISSCHALTNPRPPALKESNCLVQLFGGRTKTKKSNSFHLEPLRKKTRPDSCIDDKIVMACNFSLGFRFFYVAINNCGTYFKTLSKTL